MYVFVLIEVFVMECEVIVWCPRDRKRYCRSLSLGYNVCVLPQKNRTEVNRAVSLALLYQYSTVLYSSITLFRLLQYVCLL